MASPQMRSADAWYEITYTAAVEMRSADAWYEITFDGLIALLDYVAAQVVDVVGHSRVYNRHRHTRTRLDFEQLFVDSDGLEFWTVRRLRTASERAGNENATERVYTLQIEGLVRHQDADLEDDATEWQLQGKVEGICDALRALVTMSGLVERSWLGTTRVDDVEFAGIACHRAQVDLQAQVFATD